MLGRTECTISKVCSLKLCTLRLKNIGRTLLLAAFFSDSLYFGREVQSEETLVNERVAADAIRISLPYPCAKPPLV
jgi:hypothetical protein